MITNQPLKYHGGKSYLAKWIHSLSPASVVDDPAGGYTHRNIVFAGGLGEFWNWQPVEGISEAVNDYNYDLTSLWAVIKHDALFADFVKQVALTPFSQDDFDRALLHEPLCADDLDEWDEMVDDAVQFFVRYRQSRTGLGKDYATPTTRTRRGMNENVSAWLSAVDGLTECHERLRRVEIRNLDFAAFIREYDHPRALFYCDPPYTHETRTSTGEYGDYEMSDESHLALLEQLAGIKGRFMLSGYHSSLYNPKAGEYAWKCHEKLVVSHASNKKTKPPRVECLWTNYLHNKG